MVYRVMKPDSFDASPELGMGFHFGIHKHRGEGFIVLSAQYAIGSEEIGDGVAHLDGGAVGEAGEIHDARLALHDEIVAPAV